MTDVSNPEARPGRIDAILSTHFDECSISAADASSMAHEQRQPEGGVDRSLHRVGYLETGIPEAFTLKTLGILEVDHPSIIDGTAELTMIYPSSRDEHEELAPFLAAVVNGDVLVPIASFQKRTDGQCSYVQLGQEMVDDNLVVTSNAPRALYVEAIRKLLKEWSTEDHNYEVLPEALLVAEFLKEEVEKFQGSIDALTSKTVCKMAAEYLHDEHDGIDRGGHGINGYKRWPRAVTKN